MQPGYAVVMAGCQATTTFAKSTRSLDKAELRPQTEGRNIIDRHARFAADMQALCLVHQHTHQGCAKPGMAPVRHERDVLNVPESLRRGPDHPADRCVVKRDDAEHRAGIRGSIGCVHCVCICIRSKADFTAGWTGICANSAPLTLSKSWNRKPSSASHCSLVRSRPNGVVMSRSRPAGFRITAASMTGGTWQELTAAHFAPHVGKRFAPRGHDCILTLVSDRAASVSGIRTSAEAAVHLAVQRQQRERVARGSVRVRGRGRSRAGDLCQSDPDFCAPPTGLPGGVQLIRSIT